VNFLNFLKQLLLGFPEQFNPGEKVNSIDHAGSVKRTDGTIIGQKGGTVIVDWPRAGFSKEDGRFLCRIIAN
jgi:hypothetical protein